MHRGLKTVAPLLVAAGLVFALWYLRERGGPALVVYCASDSFYSEKILRAFEEQTGIAVHVEFDTEATKALGLTRRIIHERAHPRCDVFWNNEQLGAMSLTAQQLLEPYKGPGFERIPAHYKDPDGHWVGFAARMRVWIINTDHLAVQPDAVADALTGDLSRVAIAKPLYGTTRTHYTVLWNHWGPAELRRWHADWRSRKVYEVLGNATVKNRVASGSCDLGLTDTDDFFVAKDAGKPVAMLPFRLADERVICIPNTVAIIKGTKQLAAARKLVDFLLSEQTELALSRSVSRQIPLGPVEREMLSDEVRQLMAWASNPYPLSDLAAASESCLKWLLAEYVP